MRNLVYFSTAALIVVALAAAVLVGMSVPATEQKVGFSAPAVTEDGAGVMVPFEVTLRPGSGRMLVDLSNAYYQQDVENSLRKARAVAAREVGFSPDAFDIEVSSTGEERVVAGESAGAFFTAAIAAAYTGRALRKDTVVSAVINSDGSLSPVESIDEKAAAASALGAKRFVVAVGQPIKDREKVLELVEIVFVATAHQAIGEMLS